MFPTFFTKVNRFGAPMAGMIVIGVVQIAAGAVDDIALAHRAILGPGQSCRGHQRRALYHLALGVDSDDEDRRSYRIDIHAPIIITLIAMLYSTYAIYASGKDAVLGGTLVLALTYILYGFLAPRFMSGKPAAASPRSVSAVALAILIPLLLLFTAPPPASAASVLERVKASGKLTFGYGADARPFSYKDESGNPAGYAIALCGKIADAAKAGLGLPALAVEYVPVARDEGLRAVVQGKIDVLCEATVPTLTSRKEVSFSIPIFASGIGAVVRRDASTRLKDILSDRRPPTTPTWRANADQLIRQTTVSVVTSTRAESALKKRLDQMQFIPKMAPVDSYAAGIDRMLDGRSNVFFGDRAILLDAVKLRGLSDQLQVLDRFFTRETLAFAVPRDDENLRLIVDAALSRLFRSNEFREVYGKWFGPLNESTLSMFQLDALPD